MTHVRTKLQTRPQINTVGDILEKESVKAVSYTHLTLPTIA